MSSTVVGVPFRSANDARAASVEIVAHLRRGGLIAYPTETVYGLGGSSQSAAVAALRALKPRAQEKSFLLLVAGNEMIDTLPLDWTAAARALARKHWPGPLTLVVKECATEAVPGASTTESRFAPGVVAPLGGVAIRWTSHPAVSQLLHDFGAPITSTSANLPGAEPARDGANIVRDYGAELRKGSLMFLDGGSLPSSKASTVVDCTELVPRLLRAGAIHIDDLRATTPDLIDNV